MKGQRYAGKLVAILMAVFMAVSCISVEPIYAASKPAKVSGLSMTARTASTISIKWKKAKRAKKYQIGYKTGNGSWKYVKVSSKYKSKKLSKLKSYTKYSIKVRALRGSKKGKWSSTLTTYTKPTVFNWVALPEISSLSVSRVGPGSIELAWTVDKLDKKEEIVEESLEETQPEAVTEQPEVQGSTEETVSVQENQDAEKENTAPEGAVNEETTIEKTAVDTEIENAVSSESVEEAATETEITEPEQPDEPEIDYTKCRFRVYRSTDKKKWSLVADNLSNATRSYICRRCDVGVTYYFKVVAADTTSYKTFSKNGTYSEIVTGASKGIPGLTIHKNFTTRNLIYKEKKSYNVKGLMVHSVGASVGTATTWVDRFNKKGYDRAAVHAFVDGYTGIVEWTMPWIQRSGHAGKAANDVYVGVEMCESKYIKYTSGTKFKVLDKTKAVKSAKLTYDKTVKLFAYLCDYFGIDPKGTFKVVNSKKKTVTVNRIISHNEWRLKGHSGHYDPEHYWKGLGLTYTMSGFKKDVEKELNNNK